MTYSRIGRQESDIEEVDTTQMIQELIEMLSIPDAFTVEVISELPKVQTAKVPFEQVFLNLINNAVKHHDRPHGCVRVSAEENETFVTFAVEDDGPGIPEAFHERVFEMFQTLQPRDEVEGSGMGLAVVKKTIENRGGTIELISNGNRGTCFKFTWPKYNEG